MNDNLENIDKIVQYWLDSANKNRETMEHLVHSKDFSWALFMGHLVIEKILKAIYVKRFHKHALFTHDLLLLAKKLELDISEEYEEWLDEISTFNLNARYEDYKQKFYELCTIDFTKIWLLRIETIRLWLMNQF